MRRLFIFLAMILAISHSPFIISSSSAKETDGDVPLGGISASLQPDLFTGTLTGSIPIEVPPGRNEMQPNLVLSYASNGGNSWTGMGWKLEMGTIERQTRWGVLYNPTAQEELDGKVYTMRLNGVAADLAQAPPPAPSDEYRAKIEGGFLRIKKLSSDGVAGWEITDIKGTKYKFGTGAATRIASGSMIFKWCLERVEDRDGNYMTITYQPDGTTNQGYLSQINYTGNGATAPTNQVKFYLEGRPDAPDLYMSNFMIKTAKRLKTIEVKANGTLVRAYELNYGASSATSRSVLTSVKQHGKDAGVDASGTITPGTSLPATTFTYSADSSTFTDGNVWVTGWCPDAFVSNGPWVSPRDLNGDGRQDFWCRKGIYDAGLIFSNGNGSFYGATSVSGGTSVAAVGTGDFNADGRFDLLFLGGNCGSAQSSVALAQVSGGYGPVSNWSYVGPTCSRILGDLNGDGKADVMSTFSVPDYRIGVGISTGTGFSGPAVWFQNWCTSTRTFTGADITGDGKQDVLCLDGGGSVQVGVSTGTSFVDGSSWLSGWCPWVSQPWDVGRIGLADFNGDGKMDLFCHQTSTTKVALSTGSAFVDVGNWVTSWCASGQFGTGDFNGDGKQDVYCHPSDGTTQVALSTGSAFVVNTSPWFSSWCTTGTYGVGDFNGDGKTDVYCFNAGTVSVARSGAGLQAPDLLTSISNGLGSATTVAYTPSPQLTTTQTQLPYPVQTVTGLTTCDNWNNTTSTCTGISSTTDYSYTGGYHHIGERDFRGFKTAAVTSPGVNDADKTVTTTEFLQGRGVLNNVGGVITTAIAADDPSVTGDASLKGRPYRVTVAKKTDLAYIYAKTETIYHDDRIGANTTAPYFTPVAQMDSSVCDGGPCKTTRVSFATTDYDIYGNIKKESRHGDKDVTGDETTIERVFLTNTTDYVVSALARETIYKNLSVAAVDKLAETLFYYDGTGTGACTAAPTGSNTTVTKGHLTKTERWLSGGTNPISGMEYDPTTGVLLCTRDPLGNKTTMTYDPTKTFVLTTTNQVGHVNTVVFFGVNGVAIDPATGFYGQVMSMTDPNDKIVMHKYDALGRKTETTAPDGLVTAMTHPTLAQYGLIGTQKITISTSGASLPAALTSSTFFDGLGRTITKESSGPSGMTLVAKTEYTVKGQVSRTSAPYFKTGESVTGRWRTMSYDPPGRVTQITHPDTLSGTALTTKTCYAPFVTVTLDASGARKRETKDAYGRVVKIEEYSTTASTCDTAVGTPYATTNYTYDLLGNLTKVVDALGNRTTMRYDTLSRKIAMSDPDMSTNGTVMCGDLTALTPNTAYPWYAAPCWNYQYDTAGNLTRQTDAKTQHLWFRYDGLNRRTQKDYTTQKAAGSGDVRYLYDDTVTTFNRKGRLKQVIDAATNVTFEYDLRGQISKSSKVLDGTTYVTTSTYDGLGRLKDVTYPGATPKTVEYLYTGPVLERVRDKTGSGTTIYAIYSNYTSQGQAQTINYDNGVVTTSTFADPAHPACIPATSFKLCTLKTQKGTTPLYQDLTYTFTADGNMDLITDPINGNQDFGYDGLDRLTSATGPYGTGGATATFTYTYNQIGNMLSNPQVGTYTYPTSGAGVVRPHAATVVGTYPLTYDNNGNLFTMTDPTGFFGYSANYNVDNRLASVVTTYASVPTTSTFVYDGDGGRVKKIVGTTTTRYISKLYECDTAGATTSCSRFIWAGDTRIATVSVTSGAVHYWHGDHLGSSSVITNSTGAKVQALAYYPYGDIRTNQSFTTPAVNVPYKYTGKELDTSSNLYFYESRYYHAVFGRFISPDTMVPNPRDPQDLNRYAYAGNNPLRYTDPSGHFKIDIGDFLKREVINFFCSCYALTTPEGRQLYASSNAGVVGFFACGPVCAGAASGAVSGFMSGGDIGRSTWLGAAAGVVTWGVGAGFNIANLGDYVVTQAFVAGAASGATHAALGGGDVLQAAITGGSISAVSAYMQSSGVSAKVARVTAVNAKMSSDLRPDQSSMASPALDPGGVTGRCYGKCLGISAFWQYRQNMAPNTTAGATDPYNFDAIISNPGGARLDVVMRTPYTTTDLGSFQSQGILIPSVNLSLNYRTDIHIHVYGQGGLQTGLYDLPFVYGKTTPLPYK